MWQKSLTISVCQRQFEFRKRVRRFHGEIYGEENEAACSYLDFIKHLVMLY